MTLLFGNPLFFAFMNKLFFKIEFFFVLFCLVLPPVFFQFSRPQTQIFYFSYPITTFVLGIFGILLYFQLNKNFYSSDEKWSLFRILVISGEALKTFGFICVISVLFQLIGYFLKIENEITEIVLPSGFLGWTNFILGTLIAAFYEESVYRVFIPESMKKLLSKYKRIPSILIEVLAVLLFALGHIYLGFLGFLNAFFCGIMLRLCMIKTRSIWFSFSAHALYNFCSFFVLARTLS